MFCIYCGNNTEVTNSRPSKKSPSIWRRRSCLACKAIFSSREKPDLSLSIKVSDSSGRLEPFSEEKLLISVYECFSHRNDAYTASKQLMDTLLNKFLPVKDKYLAKALVAKDVYTVLTRFDKAAAVYYKAHHL